MNASATKWECFDIFFGFPEVMVLRPGVLDEDAEYVFTHGHCHSFAEAIRRLTFAELVFAFDSATAGAQGHVMARIDGKYLDAGGWIEGRPEEQWEQVKAIGPRGWLELSGGWFEPRVADALPFAEALLRRLGISTVEGARHG